MRLRNMSVCAAFFLAMVFSSVTFAATPAAAPPVATQDKDRMEKREHNERHPEIRKAIEQLRRAKNDLNHAAHDFGGHRAAALKACDEAIEQLQQALNYDKK